MYAVSWRSYSGKWYRLTIKPKSPDEYGKPRTYNLDDARKEAEEYVGVCSGVRIEFIEERSGNWSNWTYRPIEYYSTDDNGRTRIRHMRSGKTNAAGIPVKGLKL